MRDLVAINGPWQVITFLNFFYSEYENRTLPKVTVLFFEMDEELKKVCKSIFSKYDFIDDFIDFKEGSEKGSTLYSKIWISKLFSITPKLILEQFTTQPIFLFEEGIHSYIHQPRFTYWNIVKKSKSFKNCIKLSLNYFKNKEKLLNEFPELVYKRHVKRCVVQYNLFPLAENVVTNMKISDYHIKNILKEAYLSLENKFNCEVYKNSVIILGQYFSKLNLINENEEIEIYSKLIKNYLNQGYVVYWKGHPRFKTYDYQIKSIFGENVLIIDNHLIPLEILLINSTNVELCGVSSSALLYMKLIFNFNTKQAIHLIEDRININCFWYNDFIRIFSFMKSKIGVLKINEL